MCLLQHSVQANRKCIASLSASKCHIGTSPSSPNDSCASASHRDKSSDAACMMCITCIVMLQDIDEKAEEAYRKMEEAFKSQLGLVPEGVAVT